MKKSKFIVFEGIDGSGKTNACKIITKILNAHNIKYIHVREPGGTKLSEHIRKIIKYNYKNEKVHRKTILLLIYAARMQLIENVIKPSLENNIWVLSDRYYLSSFAYQGGGFQIKNELLVFLQKNIVDLIIPDITFYLDVKPKIAIERIHKRNLVDALEHENLDFFTRTRNAYLNLIKKDSQIITINANVKINLVHQEIQYKFQKWLKTCT